MKIRLLIPLLLAAALLCAEAQTEIPGGSELMRQVRAQLPPVPLKLTGKVRTRQKKQQQDRRLVSELRFGDEVPSATYTLSDHFGDLLTKVQVKWPNGQPVFSQWDADGNPLPAPEPLDPVADTGLTWSDLSMDFLWWPGAEVTGQDLVKTRNAFLLRIPAPPERTDLAEIRLWVDERALFVVRAEMLDSKGQIVKRIEVDSIKKVREDFWMVKDLIIFEPLKKRRMGIRFEEVKELEN